jgi:hypothetical protein
MATIRKGYVVSGFCPIDHSEVSIEIEYSSIPLPYDKEGYRVFFKTNNKCYYLRDKKCEAGNECPIYIGAESQRKAKTRDF